MLVKALLNLHRMALFAVLTVALVATGFGHRMPSASDDALALALANGVTLDDLCGGDLQPGKARDAHCLACQIAGSAGLPTVAGLSIDAELAFVAKVVAPRESRAVLRILDPAHTPQGPPVA